MIKIKESHTTGLFNNPYVLMFMLLFMWGSFSAVSKLVIAKIDSFQLQFYMLGIAVLIMTVTVVITGKIKEMKTLKLKGYLVLFLIAMPAFLYYFFYTMSLKLIPAVEASMINYIFPITTIIFAMPINREKLTKMKVVAIVLGFIGMMVILTNGSFSNIKSTNVLGDMLAFSAAISWGLFSNLMKWNRLDNLLSNYIIILISFILATINLFVFSGFMIPEILPFSGMVWLSISNIVLTYYIMTKVLKLKSSTFVANYSFLAPFATLLFIALLLGEKITYVHILGILIIISGTALQSIVDIIKKKTIKNNKDVIWHEVHNR